MAGKRAANIKIAHVAPLGFKPKAWEIPDPAFWLRQVLGGTTRNLIAPVLTKTLSFSFPLKLTASVNTASSWSKASQPESTCSIWLVLSFKLHTVHLQQDSHAAHDTLKPSFCRLWSQQRSRPLVRVSKCILTFQEAPKDSCHALCWEPRI